MLVYYIIFEVVYSVIVCSKLVVFSHVFVIR